MGGTPRLAAAQQAIGDPRMAQKDGPVRSVGSVAMQEVAGAAPGLAARGLPAHYCGRRPRGDYRGSGGAVLMPWHVAPVQQGQCGSGGGFPPSMPQGRISISMITFMSVCVNLE